MDFKNIENRLSKIYAHPQLSFVLINDAIYLRLITTDSCLPEDINWEEALKKYPAELNDKERREEMIYEHFYDYYRCMFEWKNEPVTSAAFKYLRLLPMLKSQKTYKEIVCVKRVANIRLGFVYHVNSWFTEYTLFLNEPMVDNINLYLKQHEKKDVYKKIKENIITQYKFELVKGTEFVGNILILKKPDILISMLPYQEIMDDVTKSLYTEEIAFILTSYNCITVMSREEYESHPERMILGKTDVFTDNVYTYKLKSKVHILQ